MTKTCPSCFVLHRPTECPTRIYDAAFDAPPTRAIDNVPHVFFGQGGLGSGINWGTSVSPLKMSSIDGLRGGERRVVGIPQYATKLASLSQDRDQRAGLALLEVKKRIARATEQMVRGGCTTEDWIFVCHVARLRAGGTDATPILLRNNDSCTLRVRMPDGSLQEGHVATCGWELPRYERLHIEILARGTAMAYFDSVAPPLMLSADATELAVVNLSEQSIDLRATFELAQ